MLLVVIHFFRQEKLRFEPKRNSHNRRNKKKGTKKPKQHQMINCVSRKQLFHKLVECEQWASMSNESVFLKTRHIRWKLEVLNGKNTIHTRTQCSICSFKECGTLCDSRVRQRVCVFVGLCLHAFGWMNDDDDGGFSAFSSIIYDIDSSRPLLVSVSWPIPNLISHEWRRLTDNRERHFHRMVKNNRMPKWI